MKNLLFCVVIFGSFTQFAQAQWLKPSSNQKIFSERKIFPLAQSGNLEGMAANTVIISIDDGPTIQASSLILDVLEKHQVTATFFWQGQFLRIPSRRDVVERAYRDGHVIANHTMNHELDFATDRQMTHSLMQTHDLLIPYSGNANIQLFRAPGGVWNSWRASVGNSHPVLRDYVGPIFWNAGGGDEADWLCWRNGVSPRACAAGYLRAIRANYSRGTGSLVLLHDLNIKSAELLDLVLEGLRNDDISWEFKLVEDIPAVQELAL